SPANLAVYMALAQPGDTIMGMSLPMGGHLTHGWSVSATGAWFRSVQYTVRKDSGRVDFDEVRDLALGARPKLIFCGGTAIPRTIEFAKFAEIAREVGAVLVADIAHVAGLARRGHLDHDPQDPARPPRRHAHVRRGSRQGDRQGRVPGPAGRPAQPHHRGHR